LGTEVVYMESIRRQAPWTTLALRPTSPKKRMSRDTIALTVSCVLTVMTIVTIVIIVVAKRDSSLAKAKDQARASRAAQVAELAQKAVADRQRDEELAAWRVIAQKKEADLFEDRRAPFLSITSAERMAKAVEQCESRHRCDTTAPTLAAIISTAKTDRERATLVRKVEALQADRTATDATTEPAVKRDGACEFTARRMIAKMRSCGISMAGISTEMLCSSMNTDVISYVASRECDEIEAALTR
jgi:hypothetical protein